jgi:hypothetical protein
VLGGAQRPVQIVVARASAVLEVTFRKSNFNFEVNFGLKFTRRVVVTSWIALPECSDFTHALRRLHADFTLDLVDHETHVEPSSNPN